MMAKLTLEAKNLVVIEAKVTYLNIGRWWIDPSAVPLCVARIKHGDKWCLS